MDLYMISGCMILGYKIPGHEHGLARGLDTDIFVAESSIHR